MIRWIAAIFIISIIVWMLNIGSTNDESRIIDDEEQMKWLSEYQKKKGSKQYG